MSFNNWKNWFSSKDWIFKWFLVLILLRPFIDIFWDYKNKFVFISPLQITGVLTFLLILLSFYKLRKEKLKLTKIDWAFLIFGFLLLLNGLMFLLNDPGTAAAGVAIKLSFPFYIYFYLRFFIKGKDDLNGILQTFLYSTAFPLVMFLYELIINPLAPQIAAGRPGELPRYVGLYADVASYSIYFLFAFLISGYFFLSSKKNLTANSLVVSALIFIITIGLFYLSHYSTYIIFIVLIILFFFFSFKYNKYLSYLFLFIFLFTAVLKYKDHIKSNIYPLFQIDLLVLNGKTNIGRIFNGRGFIWEHGVSELNKVPLYAKLFGVNLSAENSSAITAGAHDDFLRILFASGVAGLLSYLLVIFFTMKNSFKESIPEKYLIIGTVIILLLYSIALTPTYYYTFMYAALAVIAGRSTSPIRPKSHVP